MKQTKKAKAFGLFSQGYLPLSKEIKDIGLYSSNRYKYFYEWEAKGKPTGSESEQSHAAMGSSKTSRGEAIGGIDETKARPKNDQAEKPKPPEALSQKEQEPEGIEDEADGVEEDIVPPVTAPNEGIGSVVETRRGEKDDQGKEKKGKYEITVADQGIRCIVFLSLQTLALYEIAAAKQSQLSKDGEAKLSLGDYLDNCSELFFKDRKLKLGLVEL